MKKAILISIVMQLLFVSYVFGASVLDSVEPLGHMKYAVSMEDNFIFDRDLDKTGSMTEAETDDTNQIYGKLMLGLTDYFNVYTKLGAVTGSHYKIVEPTISEYSTEPGLLWGFGGTGAYEFLKTWKVAGDIQFNSWSVDVDEARFAGESGSNFSNPAVNNYEFQLTGLLLKDVEIPSYKITVTPYVGVSYLYFKTETDGTITYRTASTASVSDSWSLEGDDVISIVTGANVKVKDNIKLGVEGRFIGETAITCNLTYAF